jgi:hypothetical protein
LHPWIFLICDMTKRKHENTNLLSQRTPFLLKKTPRTWIASFLFFLFPPKFCVQESTPGGFVFFISRH